MKINQLKAEYVPLLESIGQTLRFHPHQTIYYQEDYGQTFYFVKKGRVRSFIIDQNGKEISLEIMGEGRIFGAADLFLGSNRTTNIEAINSVVLLEFDLDSLQPALMEDPVLCLEIIALLSKSLNSLSLHIRRLSLLDAGMKIADLLLERTKDPDPSLENIDEVLPYSHQDIADSCSLQRVTVSRQLKKMERLGWIELGYRKVKIKDREALKAYSQSSL